MKRSHSCATSLFLALVTFGLIAFGANSTRAVALTGSGATFEERLSRLEQQAANQPPARGPINAGDNAWVLVSSALVLMMTAPGLILFLRRAGGASKNVLSYHDAQFDPHGRSFSMLWMIFGYSLAFAPGNAFFGNPFTYFMLNGVGGAPNPDYSSTVPQASFMLFQMMFCHHHAGASSSGAVAERIKFKGYVLFVLLWTTLVYFPLCHMVWGKGGYFNWMLGGKIPVLDFAGGTVVHISSGTSALVCAILLGKRSGYLHQPMIPHNVVLSLVGTGLLWVGWFGFNGGSALNAGPLASSAFAATHFSAAAGALSWALVEWWHKGKPSVLGAASGMVAGLATITPASGFVTVPAAFAIGLMGGVICYFAVTFLKARFVYDDALDVFGVHGVGSMIGMLMLGWLASAAVNPANATTFQVNGSIISLVGGGRQFLNQLVAVLFTATYAGVATFILFKITNACVGLRVDAETESIGLDLSQHGERAYSE